jgi:hypothetical protein
VGSGTEGRAPCRPHFRRTAACRFEWARLHRRLPPPRARLREPSRAPCAPRKAWEGACRGEPAAERPCGGGAGWEEAYRLVASIAARTAPWHGARCAKHGAALAMRPQPARRMARCAPRPDWARAQTARRPAAMSPRARPAASHNPPRPRPQRRPTGLPRPQSAPRRPHGSRPACARDRGRNPAPRGPAPRRQARPGPPGGIARSPSHHAGRDAASAGRGGGAAAAAAGTLTAVPGLLAAAFERLPRGEQAFAVGGLSHEWRAWAAPQCAALADGDGRCSGAALLWLLQQAWRRLAVSQRSHAVVRAASDGQLDMLQWARQQRCPWDMRACSAAASRGHVVVLRWLREQGCPWGTGTCNSAAVCGQLKVLQLLREQGCCP